MTVTARDLKSMSRRELDELFRKSPAGPVPKGPSRGTALIVPGGFLDRILGGLVRLFVWKGKQFRTDADGSASLKNLISPLSIELFRAEVYPEESWFSDGPAVILDYSESSILVRMIRDEIRQVGDGLYLGQVFLWRTRVILFMLEFPTAIPARTSEAA